MHVGRVYQQAVKQRAYAHHPLAKLAQTKHQVHRDAVRIEVGVDRGCCVAAGIQPGTKVLHRLGHVGTRAGAVQLRQPGIAHGVKVGR